MAPYFLLKDLATNIISINDANINQIHLVFDLMNGYERRDLFAKKIEISATKGESLQNKLLEKALTIFYDTKKNLRKEVRSFFPKRFKTDINKEPKYALINAIYLYNSKNKINKSFEDKNINLSDFPYNAKLEESELELESESELKSESKPTFEESI